MKTVADLSDKFIALVEKRDAAQKAERDQRVVEQVAAGQCSLIPIKQTPARGFRVPLPLERLPLFVVDAFKEKTRKITHMYQLDNGEPVELSMTIGKGIGMLTTRHQDAFYKLLMYWGQHGYKTCGSLGDSHGYLEMTVWELVRVLFGDDAEHRYQRAHQTVRELHAIPIELRNVMTWQGIGNVEEFTLLYITEWKERHVDEKTRKPKENGQSKVRIQFSKFVTECFYQKDIKQLLLSPFEELRSGQKAMEVARLLYPLLDHELSTKDNYHCRLEVLSQRFGLRPISKKSHRARPFLRAFRVLNNKLILAEKYALKVDLRLCSDPDVDDYILVATRVVPNQLSLPGTA